MKAPFQGRPSAEAIGGFRWLWFGFPAEGKGQRSERETLLPSITGGGQPQIITNHPIYKHKNVDELPYQEHGGSLYRFRRMHEEIANVGGKHSLENIKQTNFCVRAAEAALPDGRKPNRTLWHFIYDARDLTFQLDFYLSDGPSADAAPRRSGYLSFKREGKKLTNKLCRKTLDGRPVAR